MDHLQQPLRERFDLQLFMVNCRYRFVDYDPSVTLVFIIRSLSMNVES